MSKIQRVKRVALLFPAALAAAGLHAQTGVIGVDPGDQAHQKQIEAAKELHEKNAAKKKGWFGRDKTKEKPSEKPTPGGGDIQVGVDVDEGPGTRKSKSGKTLREMTGSRVPGIFPVYEADKRWMLLERMPKGRRQARLVAAGTPLLVIGSKGIAQFYAQKATTTYTADCEALKAKPMRGYYLSAKSAKSFAAVGTPVIAIKLPKGRKIDSSRAKFAALPNTVREAVYKELESSIRAGVIADVKSGAFQTELDDPGFLRFEAAPDPNGFQLKIDYASDIRLRGNPGAKITVEGIQISKAYRRCLRLFAGDKAVGECAEMPHELMSETRGLQFISYDPSGGGRPFLLAYTKDAPLWGDERWGFQLTAQGPKLFLQDALDPRCREAF